jgi:hypothetical protein
MLACDRLPIWPGWSADAATGTIPAAAAINDERSRWFMRVHLIDKPSAWLAISSMG